MPLRGHEPARNAEERDPSRLGRGSELCAGRGELGSLSLGLLLLKELNSEYVDGFLGLESDCFGHSGEDSESEV